MNKILTIAVALGAVASANATQLVLWNFNDDNIIADGGVNAGLSSAALVGTTATFAGGTTSSDPLGNVSANRGWNTTGYPTQGTGSGTEGARYNVATTGGLGYKNVIVELDIRTSNTASKFYRFEYTVDGSTFTSAGVSNAIITATGGDQWVNNNTFDLSSIAGVNNNANFGFRVVSIFDPSGTGYVAANPGSNYATTGTVRFDMVEVNAQPVPEPATMIALGAGIAAIAARRRNKH